MNVALIVFLSIVGVLMLVGGPSAVRTYRRIRHPRIVRCPDSQQRALIRLDAWHAAVTAMPGPPRLHVERCSLRADHAACGEGCTAQIVP